MTGERLVDMDEKGEINEQEVGLEIEAYSEVLE